ncbi:MAG: hypothetical protein DMG03_26270, partial [Acidobacteria bacterium]
MFSAISAFLISPFLISAFSICAPSAAPQSKTKTYVQTLASERLEGRLAGSNGERLAAEFIAGELKRIGAQPLPGQRDYRLPFEFTAGTKDG